MATYPIRTVAVVGTGVIGSSWTLLFLAKGLNVIVADPAPGAHEKLAAWLKHEWVTMERIGLAENASLDNYRFVENIDDFVGQVDLIQENGPERVDFKRNLFAHLDAISPKDVLLISSSSGIPSSQFTMDCKENPGRVLIGHPFNPPHLLPLVEVVPHPGTEESCTLRAMQFYRSLGKKPVHIKQETPGFVANRLQMALYYEAYSLVSRGVISAEELDITITSGPGLRWPLTGPFMTNALGGGGSFRHLLEHIGMSAKPWVEDMRKHAFDLTPESLNTLDESVQSWINNVDIGQVERERDQVLLDLMESKSKASSLN
ncbi:uncharacterized protein TRIVIDRAFT_46955 [Trichoderma virens Gv29-8]|uniref:3-hydroxyacyl-CoA dehydrogenase n=1 Tax=Hypocrea virens (strain Gv29-8 / FGSC 10586) TaxID=413071 RepID=G9N020_HYPVG|nr:uncharacterized protein TRIVIDRAFT_46955 [Trichoderma virens Gv29-8]EHK19702.1 hypothetical protein TRIVIDRAFT_46955 [Trichoderma virens Gv29-8]